MGYRIVVAGATGNVGREVVNILAEREFPADEIAVLASSRSQGIEIEYGDTDKMLKVQNIENFDWTGWDMAIFAIGSEATKKFAPIAAAASQQGVSRALDLRQVGLPDGDHAALPGLQAGATGASCSCCRPRPKEPT